MLKPIASNLLGDNVRILKSEASKTDYQGVLIAVSALLLPPVWLSFIAPANYLWMALWPHRKATWRFGF